MHVHVISGDGEAKFWLEPAIELAKNYNYNFRQLRKINTLIEAHLDELTTAWRNHFTD